MAIKFKNNEDNENNKNSDNKIKEGVKYRIPFIVIFIIMIMLLSAGIILFNHGARNSITRNNDYYISQYRDYLVRYAKNLERYFIYYEDFNDDEAYKKILSVKEDLEKNPNFKININGEDEESQSEFTTGENDIYYENVSPDTQSPAEETQNLEYNLISGNPSAYLRKDVSGLSYTEKEVYVKNLSELLKNHREIKNYIDKTKELKYYISRGEGENKTFETNCDNFFKEPYIALVDINDYIFDESFNGEPLKDYFNKNNLSLSILISKDVVYNDKNSELYYEVVRNGKIDEINIISSKYSFAFIIAAVLLLPIVLKKYKCEHTVLKKAVKIYSMLPLIIKLFSALLGIGVIIDVFYASPAYDIFNSNYLGLLFVLIVISIFIIIEVLFILNAFKILKKPRIFFEEYEIKHFKNHILSLKALLKTGNPLLFIFCNVIYLVLIAGIIILFIVLSECSFDVFVVFCCIYLFLFLFGILLLNLITSYGKISLYIDELSLGDFKEIPEEKGFFMKPVLKLKKIKNTVKQNVENAVKSEKLKTELITNVSHDLKTPLTSIINYIELLKDMGLNDRTAVEYIDILDKKSQRLKILIEDLFEASQLATGQLKLEKTKLDLCELIKQSIGELEAKINAKEIKFKEDIPDKPVFAVVDGRRMWRVFDNLINNIIKYSPKGSRAFISIEEREDKIIICFKNTSEQELNFSADELFERFKRGDDSRSSEGSGLGLSIAKDIVELHGGNIDIAIDGDLFKVSVVIYPSNQLSASPE